MKGFKIKFTILLFIILNTVSFGFQKNDSIKSSNFSILTWNIQDLGGKKNDEEILFIARLKST